MNKSGTKTGITQEAWLFMLEHGGRWTVAELAEQLGRNTTHMDRILWSMHDVGSVTRYRSPYRKNGSAFGVSSRNRIPQRLALQDVLRAVTVRKVIDASEPAANDTDSRRNAA